MSIYSSSTVAVGLVSCHLIDYSITFCYDISQYVNILNVHSLSQELRHGCDFNCTVGKEAMDFKTHDNVLCSKMEIQKCREWWLDRHEHYSCLSIISTLAHV